MLCRDMQHFLSLKEVITHFWALTRRYIRDLSQPLGCMVFFKVYQQKKIKWNLLGGVF